MVVCCMRVAAFLLRQAFVGPEPVRVLLFRCPSVASRKRSLQVEFRQLRRWVALQRMTYAFPATLHDLLRILWTLGASCGATWLASGWSLGSQSSSFLNDLFGICCWEVHGILSRACFNGCLRASAPPVVGPRSCMVLSGRAFFAGDLVVLMAFRSLWGNNAHR